MQYAFVLACLVACTMQLSHKPWGPHETVGVPYEDGTFRMQFSARKATTSPFSDPGTQVVVTKMWYANPDGVGNADTSQLVVDCKAVSREGRGFARVDSRIAVDEFSHWNCTLQKETAPMLELRNAYVVCAGANGRLFDQTLLDHLPGSCFVQVELLDHSVQEPPRSRTIDYVVMAIVLGGVGYVLVRVCAAMILLAVIRRFVV